MQPSHGPTNTQSAAPSCSSTRLYWCSTLRSNGSARNRSDSATAAGRSRRTPRISAVPVRLAFALGVNWKLPVELLRRHCRCSPQRPRRQRVLPIHGSRCAEELGYDSERPLYKRKPKRLSVVEWRPLHAAACDELIARIACLAEASPPLDLRSHPVTARLLEEPSPLEDRTYKHREDLIDACLAAWTAALWIKRGVETCQVLGDNDGLVDAHGRRATIIAPARPTSRP